jgi:hypothetical protein
LEVNHLHALAKNRFEREVLLPLQISEKANGG